jgi:hypothetical protein
VSPFKWDFISAFNCSALAMAALENVMGKKLIIHYHKKIKMSHAKPLSREGNTF